MKEIQLTHGFVTQVDDWNYEELNKYGWVACRTRKDGPYYARRFTGSGSIYMHRQIMGVTDKTQVDHKNGDTFNNLEENLRLCGFSQQNMNQRPQTGCSSRFKGVFFTKRDNLFIAYINKDHKRHYLGSYKVEEEAALAYNKAATELFGEFARLNVL